MRRRISKKVRKYAALICGIAASNPTDWYSTIGIGLGIVDDPDYMVIHELAVAAYKRAHFNFHVMPRVGDIRLDAEAEALLLTGWSPEWIESQWRYNWRDA